jgi:hypothetical protein
MNQHLSPEAIYPLYRVDLIKNIRLTKFAQNCPKIFEIYLDVIETGL